MTSLEDRLTERLRQGSDEPKAPPAPEQDSRSSDDPDPIDCRWRVGSQVLRTLYTVDSEDAGHKISGQLFGLVDTPDLAAHIVEVHNQWLDEPDD